MKSTIEVSVDPNTGKAALKIVTFDDDRSIEGNVLRYFENYLKSGRNIEFVDSVRRVGVSSTSYLVIANPPKTNSNP